MILDKYTIPAGDSVSPSEEYPEERLLTSGTFEEARELFPELLPVFDSLDYPKGYEMRVDVMIKHLEYGQSPLSTKWSFVSQPRSSIDQKMDEFVAVYQHGPGRFETLTETLAINPGTNLEEFSEALKNIPGKFISVNPEGYWMAAPRNAPYRSTEATEPGVHVTVYVRFFKKLPKRS